MAKEPIALARGICVCVCLRSGCLRHSMILASVLRLSSAVVPWMSSLYAGTRVNSLSEGKSGNVIIFRVTLLRLCVNLIHSVFCLFLVL